MKQIEEILTRGVANIIPNKNILAGKLMSGKKLNIYLGIDPTSTKIHLGHAVVLRKLDQFALLGHNVTFLIGDFTALIGDTSDKTSERPALTTKEIEENFKTYKKQAQKLLDFSKIKVKYNSQWLKKLTFEDILKLTQHFNVGDFVGRELIRKRLTDNKKVGLHEFLYPVMQGYDSYILDTDLQVGGTDQTFNMQAGRTLIKDIKNKDSFVLTTVILEGTDGRKMSKSWGNAIWLDDIPSDMYAKIMAINDELIESYLLLATNLALEEVKAFEKRLSSKENPRDIKKELAFIIVKELYDEKIASKAQEEFESKVQNKEIPENILEINVSDGITASDTLVAINFAKSNSEAKRLIEQGGVFINDVKITDQNLKIESGIIKVGKKRFAKIVLK
ncbi:MAG: tyrosine--tRNA ligase [Patescibacteria group bacterium]